MIVPKVDPKVPFWVVAKSPERVRPEEQEFAVESTPALEALEAKGIRLARCGQYEDRFHVYWTDEARKRQANTREQQREALLR